MENKMQYALLSGLGKDRRSVGLVRERTADSVIIELHNGKIVMCDVSRVAFYVKPPPNIRELFEKQSISAPVMKKEVENV